MNDPVKSTTAPPSNPPAAPRGKKWGLTGPQAVVLAALIALVGTLATNCPPSSPPPASEGKKIGSSWPTIEPIEIDGKIRVELLGCHAEKNLGAICQLKLTSLVTDHGISLRKDSISLVDRAGQNFPPATLAIGAGSPVEVVPFPSELGKAQNVRVTFADVGHSLDDYELLRIKFGDNRVADFRPPGQFPLPAKD